MNSPGKNLYLPIFARFVKEKQLAESAGRSFNLAANGRRLAPVRGASRNLKNDRSILGGDRFRQRSEAQVRRLSKMSNVVVA